MNDTFKIRLIADNAEKREKGLMFASPLDDNEVALFIFPTNNRHGFWNKNVSFGLSLAFLDDNGRIVDFADMDAHSTKCVEPNTSNVKYVVEAKQNIFKKNGINLGDTLKYTLNNELSVHKMKRYSQ